MPTTTLKDPSLLVFGGTFDPPHEGHVQCVKQALVRFPRAKVKVLPAAQPLVRAGLVKEVATPFAHRVAMTRLAFAPLGAAVEVSTLEGDLPQPNYTLQTLRALAAPDTPMALLLGLDQWRAFANWHEPLAILGLADVLVVARGDGDSVAASTATAAALGLTLAWPEPTTAELGATGHRLYLLPEPVSAAASTVLRQAPAGRGETAGWLAAAVAAYIDQHQLYPKG